MDYKSSTTTDNLDSFTSSTGSVILALPIINGSNQILYQNLTHLNLL